MIPLIEQHLDAIRALCREYGVARRRSSAWPIGLPVPEEKRV